jgi:CYTH domain-containing protein
MAARKFLVASGIARLVRRQIPTTWVVEGYLNGGEGRSTHVQLQGDKAVLVLAEESDGQIALEETTVPRRHAEALLDVSIGRIDIDRAILPVDGQEILLDRISTGGRMLDVATVITDSGPASRAFRPPAWLGPEVTGEEYANRSLALAGVPGSGELSVSNSGLEDLLDLLDATVGRRPRMPERTPEPRAEPAPPPPPEQPVVAEPPQAQPAASAQSSSENAKELARQGLSRVLGIVPPLPAESLAGTTSQAPWEGRKRK